MESTSYHGMHDQFPIDSSLIAAAIARPCGSCPLVADPMRRDIECYKHVCQDDNGSYVFVCGLCNYHDKQPTRFRTTNALPSQVKKKAIAHAKMHATLALHGCIPHVIKSRGWKDREMIQLRESAFQGLGSSPGWLPHLTQPHLQSPPQTTSRAPPAPTQPPRAPPAPPQPQWVDSSPNWLPPHLQSPSQPMWRQTSQPPSQPSTPLPQPALWPTTTQPPWTTSLAPPAPTQPPRAPPAPPRAPPSQTPWSLSRPPSCPPVMIDVSGVEDEQCLSVRRDERPPMDSGSGRERDSSSRVSLGDLQQYLQQQAQQRQEWGGLMQQMQQQFQQQQQAAEDITATVLAAAESATAAAASATTAATSAGTFAAAATSAAAASAQLFGADTIGRALQVVGGQFRVASGTRPTALFFCASGWPTDLYRRLLPSLGHMAKERQPGEEPSLDWQGWKLAGYPADGTPFVANALQLLSESSPGFTEAFTSQFEGLGAPPLTIHGLAAPGTDGGYNHKAQVDKLITKMRAILKTRPNTQLIVVGYVPLPALSLDSSLCLTCPCPCLTKCPFAGWRRSPASSPTSWPSTIAEAATSTGPPLPEMYLLLGLSSPTRRC